MIPIVKYCSRDEDVTPKSEGFVFFVVKLWNTGIPSELV